MSFRGYLNACATVSIAGMSDSRDEGAAKGEWAALGSLASKALGGAVRIVGDTHGAISSRVESVLPPVAKPYGRAQATSAGQVYQIVEAVHRGAPRLLGLLDALTSVEPSRTRTGGAVQPLVNGLFGDLIAEEHPELSVPMSVRVDGRDARLPDDFAGASADVVVFIHGLAEDERHWESEDRRSYGQRLGDDGFTPVFVRYNSGLHISDNGWALSGLLEDLVVNWPVPVRSVSLVGHSMGGLVARSACHVGGDWTALVHSVVTLGTPHRGAPLEKAVHVADWAMRRIPEAEPVGRILARRSVGVKDLRFGSLVEEDWRGRDVDAFLDNRRSEVPFLPHITYYWVAATLTRDPEHPFGRLVGDGMVRFASASDMAGSGITLGGLSHQDLLNEDAVYEALARWLVPAAGAAG
jgi:pimeloyl-ACP methyl ester carboxylesterase